ncbi:uncharacterized protein MONOS_1655 [Monocercomonoides exilis]|uniref:uncharacterized protein n=1 Tax=Monocercomonoides exilis TaxID=2049356 RepID=UPI0035594430|nr:hypothetical protein MONOS_1655 [Monocercomonoides exilis]|eukprot:MONOS_1655.1-p1 / transcript=MONOS_1655.1 / gene=MONOS_1655 / organism=Monocercomonoides_exilis_PA203 / gene_product=unspecified product / transcript_product=unspecified product / location=Mono_scaffold00030:137133-137489(+) / protein_length=119 / sequence_SO=supercontig / SO=protein_coding / is_pseudo=false
MEDAVLSPASIALTILEKREEAEEGERRGKEGGKEGEENGEKEGKEEGGREGGDEDEEKGGRPIAHGEFVKRIKENQRKLEEAMALLVVEAFGLSRLRSVKAVAEADSDKQHFVEPEV